jgi:hypothetical protein
MYFKSIVEQWKQDFIHHRGLFILEMVGTLSSIAASVFISFWGNKFGLQTVFYLWLVGSVSLAIAAWIRKTAWPMLLMLVYTFFNLIGLYNTL